MSTNIRTLRRVRDKKRTRSVILRPVILVPSEFWFDEWTVTLTTEELQTIAEALFTHHEEFNDSATAQPAWELRNRLTEGMVHRGLPVS